MIKNRWFAITLVLFASADLHAAVANFCGDLENAYGPYDYRRRAEFQENFRLVEHGHFSPDVENGIRGKTSTIGGDLSYTLRAIPNHHRALNTLAVVALRDKTLELKGMGYPVECWYDRAIRFTPDDTTVYVTYGSYLFARGKTSDAIKIFKEGLSYAPDHPTLNYNLGLAYLKQQNYPKAQEHGKKAYQLGFPLQGLKNKLVALKQWDVATKD